MELRGMKAIRYFSVTNEWIDCVAVVPEEFHDAAAEVIRKAVAMFWNDEYEAYGDAIENELALADIPFDIRYIAWDNEEDKPMDEAAWEAWIGEVQESCGVTNVYL